MGSAGAEGVDRGGDVGGGGGFGGGILLVGADVVVLSGVAGAAGEFGQARPSRRGAQPRRQAA